MEDFLLGFLQDGIILILCRDLYHLAKGQRRKSSIHGRTYSSSTLCTFDKGGRAAYFSSIPLTQFNGREITMIKTRVGKHFTLCIIVVCSSWWRPGDFIHPKDMFVMSWAPALWMQWKTSCPEHLVHTSFTHLVKPKKTIVTHCCDWWQRICKHLLSREDICPIFK